MKIKITENKLNEIVSHIIKEFLDKEMVYDYWNNLSKKYIKEGLTTTYSLGKIKNILSRKYDFRKMNAIWGEIDNNPNSTDIKSYKNKQSKTTQDSDSWYSFSLELRNGVQDNVEEIKDLIHTCDACGWYLSDCVYFIRNGMTQEIDVKNNKTIDFESKDYQNTPLLLTFRAKYNKEYEEIPQFLYHICPLRVVDKILKQGLTPRNNGRIASHPERVYLFTDYPTDWKENILPNFQQSGKNEEYVLLSVDTKTLNNIKFYNDSNRMSGYPAVYTLEPIPPSAIQMFEK